MYVLKNKTTGEVIDPRGDDFFLTPGDIDPCTDTWDAVLGLAGIETDIIDGYAVVVEERDAMKIYSVERRHNSWGDATKRVVFLGLLIAVCASLGFGILAVSVDRPAAANPFVPVCQGGAGYCLDDGCVACIR